MEWRGRARTSIIKVSSKDDENQRSCQNYNIFPEIHKTEFEVIFEFFLSTIIIFITVCGNYINSLKK